MQKKILFQIILILALVACVGVAVAVLFSGNGSKDNVLEEFPVERKPADICDDYPGLAAIPLDAAMILSNKSVSSAVELLTDQTAIYRTLFAGTGKKTITPFIDSLATPAYKHVNGPCIISMHYSRDLEPLMVLSGCKKAEQREQLLNLAATCHLEAAAAPEGDPQTVLVSTSQSLIAASKRHLEIGSSILDDAKFISAASIPSGRDAIFFMGKYAPKAASLFMSRDYAGHGAFFASYADVLVLTPEKTKNGYELGVYAACKGNPAFRIGFMDTEESTAAKVLPAETVFAVSMTTDGVGAYIERYKKFLDANSKLARYSDSAEKWARSLDIREVAKAVVRYGEKWGEVLLIKTGSKPSEEVLLKDTGLSSLKEYRTAVVPYAYAGYAATQFGPLFSAAEESFFFYKDGWMVVGDNKTLTDMLVEDSESLSSTMGKEGIKLNESPMVYFDVASYLDKLQTIFSKPIALAISSTLKGVSGEVFTVSGKKIEVKRVSPAASASKADPSKVTVPAGPFTVLNSQTGKKNTLTQKADNSLEFKDENGKVSWTKPFDGKLCGVVSEIDYYNNKRIQYLVCAGSKLYLIDRLGRIVKGFPAELGKEVLLGPAAYDFSGAHGYSALVLHYDNTIGLYDIHGRVRQGWKGIAPQEQIVSLPELSQKDGKKVWIVNTVSKTYTYPFNGGEPLSKEKRKNK